MTAKSDDKDGVVMCPESRLIAERYGILERAKKRFWLDWLAILQATGEELEEDGWVVQVGGSEGDGWGMLQIARPHWPKPFNVGIHFEVWLDQALAAKERAAGAKIYLDVEDGTRETQEKEDIAEALKRVLLPYERAGVLHREAGLTLPAGKTCRLFERTIPLAQVGSRSLARQLRRMAVIVPLIDEACFVKQGTPIWRTDFLPGDLTPGLEYEGTGGLSIQAAGGPVGNGAIRIDGPAQGNHKTCDGKPTHIMKLWDSRGFVENGAEAYLSCLIKTTGQNNRLWFIGDSWVANECVAVFEEPHWIEKRVLAQEGYQHVAIRVRARNPQEYNFRDLPVTVWLRVQTDDPTFSIGAIEIGRC